MKASLLLRFRLAAGWLCAVILLTGLHSTKAFITDCSKPIMLGQMKFKDATLEEAVAGAEYPQLPGTARLHRNRIGCQMKCEIEVHTEFIV